MFNPNFIAKIEHKMYLNSRRILQNSRRRQLKIKDFTIISNNCWGGICYEHFGLRKNSPTVGCFIFAEEYLKMCSNFQQYMQNEIQMISFDESKHIEWLKRNHVSICPVGLLNDIEIIFMHYKNADVAKEKWIQRVNRINYNRLIFKFSFMNECSVEQLREFDNLALSGTKFMFVNREDLKGKCGIYYPGYEKDDQITNDTFYWNKYLDVPLLINEGILRQK